MANTPVMAATPVAASFQDTRHINIAGQLASVPGTGASSATASFTVPVSGTFSKAAFSINNVGTGRSVTLTNNTSATAIVVSMTDGVGGIFTDDTNSVSVSSNDIIVWTVAESSTNPTAYASRLLFNGSSVSCSLHAAGAGNLTSSGHSFTPIILMGGGGGNTFATAETEVAHLIRAPGVAQYFQLSLSTNSRTQAQTVTTRLNSSNGNQSIVISTGVTGLLVDTSNTDTLVSSNTYCCAVSSDSGTGTLAFVKYSVAITSTGILTDICGGANNNQTRADSTTAHYFQIAGDFPNGTAVTTESQEQMTIGASGTLSNMRFYVSSSTQVTPLLVTTFNLRINSSNGNQSITASSVTGWYEDTSNTDTHTSTDLLNYSVISTVSTVGTLGWRAWAITDSISAAAPAVPDYNPIVLSDFSRPQISIKSYHCNAL